MSILSFYILLVSNWGFLNVLAQFRNYNCDPLVCKLPTCRCASTNAPVNNPPQFILVSYDDAVNTNVFPQAISVFKNRRNPNGCPAKGTWFAQVEYSDPMLVSQWHALGHEVADHSMTHKSPFAGSLEEIDGMKKWASTFAGVSKSRIRGVRFPFRNYNAKAIGMIKKLGFEYDSSMSANSADAIWPYTLDNGSVNECMGSVTVCGQMLNASGLWEIPLYGTFRDSTMTHLMDPYNDPSLDNPIPPETLVSNYINHFNANYNGNRVPTGVYMHPIWLGSGNPPTIPDGRKKLKAITDFLDMAMANKDVWMVTHSQLLDYMKNPVPADQLSTQTYMKCPEVPKGICNGADPSLFQNCRLGGTQFSTCYNCPVDYPSLKIPIPKLQSNTRCMPPTDCDALFWDPVGCKCLCNNADCKSLDPLPVEDIDEQDINLQKSSDGSTHDNESVKNSGENLSMELLTIASYLFITLYFQ